MATLNSLPRYPQTSCNLCENYTCSNCVSNQNNHGTTPEICSNKSKNIIFQSPERLKIENSMI